MRTRTRIALAGLALGAALAGGVAWATIPADDSLYTACKLRATGTIRLIDPSGPTNSLLSHCTSYETQISWNQKGQKGEPGTAGANGTNGAAGPKGADGTNGAKGDAGAAGTNGTNGSDGKDGAKGETGSVGPQGPAGPQGPDGARGPVGPPGPAGSGGGSLASLDALDGIACNATGTAGTISVTYGPPPGSAVTLACTPTATPTLTVTKTGTGIGTVASNVGGIACGSTCSQDFTAGTVVTLTATSADDIFTGWSGACSGTGLCTVTMSASRNVTAGFVAGADLTISQGGGVLGQVCNLSGCAPVTGTRARISSDPAGLSCDYTRAVLGAFQSGTCVHRFPSGILITLTYTSIVFPALVNWGGPCGNVGASVGGTCTFELEGDETVTAGYYYAP
jgi:hypothetical protein